MGTMGNYYNRVYTGVIYTGIFWGSEKLVWLGRWILRRREHTARDVQGCHREHTKDANRGLQKYMRHSSWNFLSNRLIVDRERPISLAAGKVLEHTGNKFIQSPQQSAQKTPRIAPGLQIITTAFNLSIRIRKSTIPSRILVLDKQGGQSSGWNEFSHVCVTYRITN